MRFFAVSGKRRRADRAFGTWTKSSLSAYTNCVEVQGLSGDTIRVRDSKSPRAGVLDFTPAEWDAFIGGVRLGEFDRRTRA